MSNIRCGLKFVVIAPMLLSGLALLAPVPAAGEAVSADRVGKAVTGQETVHRQLDTIQADRFLLLIRTRGGISEELAVFRRVFEEKQKEISAYNMRLTQVYRVDPATRYRFDPASNALFFVEARVVGGKTNLLQRFDRTFDREIGKAFAKETLGKSLANRQMLVLKQLAREKMHESELVNAALSKEFGIDPAAQYRYDDVTRAIIKLATPPGGKARSAQTAPPAASKTAASLPAGKTGSGTRR
jgi:hypothetical protein